MNEKRNFWKSMILISVVFVLLVWTASYLFGRFKVKADARPIMFSSIDDYKAYESADRDQALLKAQVEKLNIQYNIDEGKKKEIRKRLGVPDNFIEQREASDDPQSPVKGFIEQKPAPPAPVQVPRP